VTVSPHDSLDRYRVLCPRGLVLDDYLNPAILGSTGWVVGAIWIGIRRNRVPLPVSLGGDPSTGYS
jgi:hypothetical protein